MADTQAPATRSAAVASTVWVNVVLGLMLTVTWPVVGFCTSSVEPDTAAAVPKAPCAGELPGAVVVGLWLEEGLVDAVLEPPQAAAASASTPRPTKRALVLAVTVIPDMSSLLLSVRPADCRTRRAAKPVMP